MRYMTEEVLVPLGLGVPKRGYNRYGILLVEVPAGEEDLWIARLKENGLVSSVSLNGGESTR